MTPFWTLQNEAGGQGAPPGSCQPAVAGGARSPVGHAPRAGPVRPVAAWGLGRPARWALLSFHLRPSAGRGTVRPARVPATVAATAPAYWLSRGRCCGRPSARPSARPARSPEPGAERAGLRGAHVAGGGEGGGGGGAAPVPAPPRGCAHRVVRADQSRGCLGGAAPAPPSWPSLPVFRRILLRDSKRPRKPACPPGAEGRRGFLAPALPRGHPGLKGRLLMTQLSQVHPSPPAHLTVPLPGAARASPCPGCCGREKPLNADKGNYLPECVKFTPGGRALALWRTCLRAHMQLFCQKFLESHHFRNNIS